MSIKTYFEKLFTSDGLDEKEFNDFYDLCIKNDIKIRTKEVDFEFAFINKNKDKKIRINRNNIEFEDPKCTPEDILNITFDNIEKLDSTIRNELILIVNQYRKINNNFYEKYKNEYIQLLINICSFLEKNSKYKTLQDYERGINIDSYNYIDNLLRSNSQNIGDFNKVYLYNKYINDKNFYSLDTVVEVRKTFTDKQSIDTVRSFIESTVELHSGSFKLSNEDIVKIFPGKTIRIRLQKIWNSYNKVFIKGSIATGLTLYFIYKLNPEQKQKVEDLIDDQSGCYLNDLTKKISFKIDLLTCNKSKGDIKTCTDPKQKNCFNPCIVGTNCSKKVVKEDDASTGTIYRSCIDQVGGCSVFCDTKNFFTGNDLKKYELECRNSSGSRVIFEVYSLLTGVPVEDIDGYIYFSPSNNKIVELLVILFLLIILLVLLFLRITNRSNTR